MIEVEESSGNVFADLDLPNPEERLAKALLSRATELPEQCPDKTTVPVTA